VAFYYEDEAPEVAPAGRERVVAEMGRTPAYLPLDYLREPEHRLEFYRRLAQARQPADLTSLKKELRDRFGPLPPAVELLLGVHELRILAAAKGVASVEVVEGKVKLTRNRDLITVGGQFPRLGTREAKARLQELKRLILSLSSN
jgi:transcription-repair coupling factor (superfamily II helicase)